MQLTDFSGKRNYGEESKAWGFNWNTDRTASPNHPVIRAQTER